MPETDLSTVLTIIGMILLSVLSRSFFFLSSRQWSLPGWAQRGLHYAPVAALSAVIAPQILMTDGVFIDTWRNAQLFGLLAASAWYWWQRGVLGTIVTGMAVFLPLRLWLGW